MIGSDAPHVSVVVATYRREESLCDTLSDLLAQVDVDAEIIVVDQTPQHTPATDAFLAKHAARLKLVHVVEPNLPNARNVGVRVARGPVIVFCDDDLRLPATLLRDMRAHFESPEVGGLAPMVVVEGQAPGRDLEHAHRFNGACRQSARLRVDNVIGVCMAFRRVAVLEVGGFDPLLGHLNRTGAGEDLEFCRRFTGSGRHIWLTPGIRVIHRGFEPGGCEVRTGANANAEEPHLRANTYIVLKEERAFERLTARALYRLLRSSVLRRDVLQGGPRTTVSALVRLRKTVLSVQRFWREHANATEAPPP